MTNETPTVESALLSMLKEDNKVIAYRPRISRMVGTTSAILLQQMYFRYEGRPFYKLKSPCSSRLYKTGDSWCEELGFNSGEFDTALRHISTKCTKGKSKTELLDECPDIPQPESTETKKQYMKRLGEALKYLIVFWTDHDHVTWYNLNTKLFAKLLIAIYIEKLDCAIHGLNGESQFIFIIDSKKTNKEKDSPETSSGIETGDDLRDEWIQHIYDVVMGELRCSHPDCNGIIGNIDTKLPTAFYGIGELALEPICVGCYLSQHERDSNPPTPPTLAHVICPECREKFVPNDDGICKHCGLHWEKSETPYERLQALEAQENTPQLTAEQAGVLEDISKIPLGANHPIAQESTTRDYLKTLEALGYVLWRASPHSKTMLQYIITDTGRAALEDYRKSQLSIFCGVCNGSGTVLQWEQADGCPECGDSGKQPIALEADETLFSCDGGCGKQMVAFLGEVPKGLCVECCEAQPITCDICGDSERSRNLYTDPNDLDNPIVLCANHNSDVRKQEVIIARAQQTDGELSEFSQQCIEANARQKALSDDRMLAQQSDCAGTEHIAALCEVVEESYATITVDDNIKPETMEALGGMIVALDKAVKDGTLPKKPAPKLTPHTLMKNALVAAMGLVQDDITTWGEFNKASKLLRSAGATPEDIPALYSFTNAEARRKNYQWESPVKMAERWPAYKKQCRGREATAPQDESKPLDASEGVVRSEL